MVTPSSALIRACSASTRRAATSKPDESKIWLPMWECSPRSSRPGTSRTRRTASQASPLVMEKPELLVLVRGGDVFVGVRLHTGGHPHHHRLRPGERACRDQLGGDLGEPLDLDERVEHDPSDALVHRSAQLGVRLVVAVVADPLRVEARPQRHRQLAGGAHVEVEALLGDPLRDRRAEERLARIEDVVLLEAVAEGSRPRPEVRLVEDVRRGVHVGDQVGQRQPADGQLARVVLVRRHRPEVRHERVGVGRLTQPGRTPQSTWSVCPAGFVSHATCAPVQRRRADPGRSQRRSGSPARARAERAAPASGPRRPSAALGAHPGHRTCGTSRPSPRDSAPPGAARATGQPRTPRPGSPPARAAGRPRTAS